MPDRRPVKSLGGLLHPGPDSDYGRRGRSEWLDFPWSRYQHQTRIDDREVRYVDAGEGPALVFVHGLGASWQSWLENIPEFARVFSCKPGQPMAKDPAQVCRVW